MTDVENVSLANNSKTDCIRVWLGGSFDPIHCGHLQMIQHVYKVLKQTFPSATVIAKLLPTAGSPLKQKPTATADRLAMLNIAIQPLAFLSIDNYELQVEAPVFSYNTFKHFKALYPDDTLIFIMGEDSLRQLHQWYRGYELLAWTNLWVLPRPALYMGKPTHQQNDLFKELDKPLKSLVVNSQKYLKNQHANHIYIDDYVLPDIASRDIRHWLYGSKAQQQLAKSSLPIGVYHYIVNHRLYASLDSNSN